MAKGKDQAETGLDLPVIQSYKPEVRKVFTTLAWSFLLDKESKGGLSVRKQAASIFPNGRPILLLKMFLSPFLCSCTFPYTPLIPEPSSPPPY